ncbi:MAG: EamA family transporter [Thermoplasmatota archaeon]|nr:EamA family transporter [Halobacteriales archaeon]
MAATRNARVALALAALYVIWGTTYYVIRQAVLAMPPLTMAAIRYIIPGLALYAWTRFRGAAAPTKPAWLRAAVLGGLMLAIGNGTVSYAETRMPSGIAALLVTMVPMWTVGLDWFLAGVRPRPLVVAGLALGLCGVALLMSRDSGGWTCAPGSLCSDPFDLRFMLLIMFGSGCWALGSLRSRKGDAPKSFWQDLGMQMLAGGAILGVAGVVLGEPASFHPLQVSWKVWAGVLYLSLFGSVVALGAFLWLLRTTSPAVATTYAFVNPAVAVLLAAALGDQPLTWFVVGASALIVAGVALIVAGKKRGAATTPPAAPLPPE